MFIGWAWDDDEVQPCIDTGPGTWRWYSLDGERMPWSLCLTLDRAPLSRPTKTS